MEIPVPRATYGVAALLFFATLSVFTPALGNGFIDVYDDGPYVLGNEMVRRGLTPSGVAWAFRSFELHNWHPLTWLSHMADVDLFGIAPAGHHLTSVLLHSANAALAVLLFASLGAGPALAGILAALFALHPLRVQSVAWVAERKDVLAAFFGLLALLAYLRHARRGGAGALALALFAFALGLLSKPSLVPLPIVLLLLDYWPLGRLGPRERRGAIREKIPFALLSAASAAVTLAAQWSTGAVVAGSEIPFAIRLGNAAVSVWAYLAKLVWPAGLAVYYPHPGSSLSVPLAVAAGVALVGATSGVLAASRRAPWLAVGWLWYLALLLPVLGVVQVGRQAMADRYTYLPTLGILLAAGFTAAEVARRAPALASWALSGAGVAAAALLAVATRGEIRMWKDSATLFGRAMAVTERNSVAANALGVLEAREGRVITAVALYEQAVSFDPRSGTAQQNLAAALLALDRDVEAWPHALEAVQLEPRNPQARLVLGMALESVGRAAEAESEYQAALAIEPRYGEALRRLERLRSAPPGAAPAP